MGYINDNIITDEQVEKFHLEYFNHVISEDRISYGEEFPGHAAKNIKRIKKHIKDQFINSPNPYIEKQRIVREPMYKVNKDAYTLSEYGSRDNPGLCFCQMCEELFDRRYIERNDIQKKPKFAWEQMYLCLCLTCSKDYILLRNNKTIWERFIDDIKNADVEGEENVQIEIGGEKTIIFTGTHIAEIQAIFDILGKDIYEIIEDEEDE